MKSSGWYPAGSGERVRTIDIIRGLALFGVLIVNILSDFRIPLLEHIRTPFADSGWVDRAAAMLTAGVLEFKAFTIFSFLFGVGVAIQIERAAKHGVNARYFLLKRMAWLFVLGTIHLFLVWNGDILTLYAVCGLLLLAFVGLPSRILFLIGAALIVIPEFVSLGLSLPAESAAAAVIAQTRQVYGTQGFLPILKFRWFEAWSLIIPILTMVLWRTTGLMYWGVAAWRSGILRAPEQHRGKLAAALAIGLVTGGAITANDVWASSSGRAPWPALQHTHLDASILLALAYVSGLLLWLTPRRVSLLPGLAALGRMALTNYLMQSIVLGFLFYGYGFGLMGRIGPAAAAAIGLAIYMAQMQLSRVWLRHFRFGPFEWLWRSLAYGRRQPMRTDSKMVWWTGRHLSRRAGIGMQLVGFSTIHLLAAWALSLLWARHGWAAGRPGTANLIGLFFVGAGSCLFVLCLREHFLAAPSGWLLEKTPHYPTPGYLLTAGPYRYSCNPIYLAELTIWLGWIAFYGSLVLAGTLAVVAVVVGPIIVPREERGLEARFGEQYREFRRTTPRWLGKPRR